MVVRVVGRMTVVRGDEGPRVVVGWLCAKQVVKRASRKRDEGNGGARWGV
jgi:hypothetical protein